MTLAFAALALVLGSTQVYPCADHPHRPALVRVADGIHADLQHKLMDKVHAMNTKSEGIFHEDVSAIIAPYFPVGQSIADTRKIIAESHLGTLMPFKGEMMAGETAPFATEFQLMGTQYSEVEVVIHFDFKNDGKSNQVLKSVHAYLRDASM